MEEFAITGKPMPFVVGAWKMLSLYGTAEVWEH
jgi:hypothetical protein